MSKRPKTKIPLAEAALLAAAILWGLCLVFQRKALDSLSPMAYHGMRITFGALFLLPVAWGRLKRQLAAAPNPGAVWKNGLFVCIVAGTIMCVGSGMQQYALLWTSVAKVGFITSLYVVIIPLALHVSGKKIATGEVAGAALALAGLYLLSVADNLSLSKGDILVLIAAFVWAGHVIFLGHFSPRMDPFVLSAGQALAAGLLALSAMAILGETPDLESCVDAWPLVVFGGLFSVTMGYTLQIYGQRQASPTVTAVILQLESVFAAITGWFILGEGMTGRMIIGAAIMFFGALLAQLRPTAAPVAPDE